MKLYMRFFKGIFVTFAVCGAAIGQGTEVDREKLDSILRDEGMAKVQKLTMLDPFLNNKDAQIAGKAFVSIAGLNNNEDKGEVRQKVVEAMARALATDPPQGDEGVYARRLSTQRKEDFADAAKRLLRKYLNEVEPKSVTRAHLLLADKIDINTFDKEVESLAGDSWKEPQSSKWHASKRWAALMIQARRGDQSAMDKLIKRFMEEPFLHRKIAVLPDLVYTRHKDAYNVMASMLLSEERLAALRKGQPGTPVSMRVAEVMAGYFDDFPVKHDFYGNYTAEEIELCREWVKVQPWYKE